MSKSQATRPKVSVVVPSYNHEKYIKDALDGFVMQQTDFAFEVLVADDCSTDKTPEIIRQYARKYPDIIKPILRKKNLGVLQNFVETMQQARGEFLALCEGDDYWTDPEKLQRQVTFMEKHPEYALSFHGVKVQVEGGKEPDYVSPSKSEEPFTNYELVRRNFIQTCSVMYRTQKYENIPQGMLPIDWYLHLYHARFGKVGFIDRVMAVYRRHPNGIWQDSYADTSNLWRKHGLKWLALHMGLLQLYSDNAEYKKIISGTIINLFDALAEIDKKHGETLTRQAINQFPESGEIYIHNLLERVDGLDAHSKEQAKIIQHYIDINQHLDDYNRRLAGENQQLKNKPFVRLERAAKRTIKRNRV
jgi:glycosyltransferase involved in cell wall biosynthesis